MKFVEFVSWLEFPDKRKQIIESISCLYVSASYYDSEDELERDILETEAWLARKDNAEILFLARQLGVVED